MAERSRFELCIEEAVKVLSEEVDNVIAELRARGFEDPLPHIVAEVVYRKQGGNVGRKLWSCAESAGPPRFPKEEILKTEQLADMVETFSAYVRPIIEGQVRILIFKMMGLLGRIGVGASSEFIGNYMAWLLEPIIEDMAKILNSAKDEGRETAKAMVRGMVRDAVFHFLHRDARTAAVIYRLERSRRTVLDKAIERGRKAARAIASMLLAPFTIFTEDEKREIEDEAEKIAARMYEVEAETMPKDVRVIPEIAFGPEGYWALKEIEVDITPEGYVVTRQVFEFMPRREEPPSPPITLVVKPEKRIEEIIRYRVDVALTGLRRELIELERFKIERAIERLEKIMRRKKMLIRLRPYQYDLAYKALKIYPEEGEFGGSLLALAYMMQRHKRRISRHRQALAVYQELRSVLELMPERFFRSYEELRKEFEARARERIERMVERAAETRKEEIRYYASNVARIIERVYSHADPAEVGAGEVKKRIADTIRLMEDHRRMLMQRESSMYSVKLEALKAVIEGRHMEVVRNIAVSEIRYLVQRLRPP